MPKKTKILYIITQPALGGAQSYVRDLIEGFYKKYDIYLATGSEGPLTEAVKIMGVNTYIIPSLTRSINPLTEYRAVQETTALIRKIQPDLIHANSSKAGIIGRIAGKICNVPTIFTAHGWGFSHNNPLVRRIIALLAEKLVAFISTKIICVSESDRQLASEYKVGNEQILSTIFYGISNYSVALANPSIQPPHIIMVARFNEQKDQPTLLKAIAQLQNPNLQVDFVGSGISLNNCEVLAQSLGIAHQVSFLGDRIDVPDLLAQAQIFVLSTHYEGLPISILEAMRSGLPVVATNVNGIPEEVEHGKTGLLIPHADVDALVSALKSLIESPEVRQKMGESGRQKFLQCFTVEHMLLKTERVYQEILTL